MKKLISLLITALLLVAIQPEVNAQINLKKLKNNANKIKIKKKPKKEKNTTKKANLNSSQNETENTNNKPETSSASNQAPKQEETKKKLFDPNYPISVDFIKFFKNINLECETGKMTIPNIILKNLGERQRYGYNDDDLKVRVTLSKGENKIDEMNFKGDGKGFDKWSPLYVLKTGFHPPAFNFTEKGYYKFVLTVGEKIIGNYDVEIIKVELGGKTGYFINKPFIDLAIIGTGDIKKEGNSYVPNSNATFFINQFNAKFKFGIGSNDPIQQMARLMKVNPQGNDIFLGGNYDNDFAPPSKVGINSYYFLTYAGKSVSYGDVVNNDGDYYVEIITGRKKEKYPFSVKNKEITTNENRKIDEGRRFVRKEDVQFNKEKSYLPIQSIAGIKDNVRMNIKLNNNRSIGKAAHESVVFTDGNEIDASILVSSSIKAKYQKRYTEFTVSVVKGNKVVAQAIKPFILKSSINPSFPSLTNNTDKSNPYTNKDLLTGEIMLGLSELPAGAHKLKIVWEIKSGKISDILGVKTVTFNSKKINSKYKKWGNETNKLLYMTEGEISKHLASNTASNQRAYFINNCGSKILVKQSTSQKYDIPAGGKVELNLNKGNLSKYNYASLSWGSPRYLKSHKTIYILDNNAFNSVVEKHPTWGTKLKSLVGQEFQNQSAYTAKAKALVGNEIYLKYKDLIIQSASLDFINVCQ